ncbi:MAG: ferredoxin--nitrite reductase [Sulfurimonas sp.]|nr:MAG: ferredoxin--nitrite reductase [Sulfurimonas sp.]
MVELEKAYEARSKKINKMEKIKELKSPKEAFDALEMYAKNGYASIPNEDKTYFLKCFGIFDRPATPERFMIRLRIPGGFLNSTQARAIGECAKDFGQDYIDLTTRAQAELRYIKIEDIPTIFKKLSEVGIDSYQTGVDNFRNILNDPLDEMGFDNILPSQKLLLKLQSLFLHNPEWISALPRKFNTSISGSMSNRCNVFGHDCCFILAQKDGVYGYNMYLGGKVGKVAQKANIFLANEDEVVKAFESITDIFKRYGFRDNRNKNRLHFLIEAVGMDVIAKSIRENAGIDFAPAGETMTKIDFYDPDQGRVQLRDGSFAVHVVVPSGIFTGKALIDVAKHSEVYGNSEIRLDIEQSLYIMGVKDTYKLLEEDFFNTYKNINTPYMNHLIACAGTEHCPYGVIENKNDAINMAKYLGEKVPLDNAMVRMYWSACVKGCGIHGLADIGFEGCKTKINGKPADGVNISLGGKLISEGKEGHAVMKFAPLKYAPYYVETLMLEYKRLKLSSESFESFHDRVLSLYTLAYTGFIMKLGAYLRSKDIDMEFAFSDNVNTGKNEEFEVFELGRKLYYKLAKKEAYSSYNRFTNVLKSERPTDIKELVPNIDENIALMLEEILNQDESKRAVVFSQLNDYISLY